MTTNSIDELIDDLYNNTIISYGEAEALRSQQAQNSEAMKERAWLISRTESAEILHQQLSRQLSAIRQAVEKAKAVTGGGVFLANAHAVDEIEAILNTVKDAPVCNESLPPVDSEPAQQPESKANTLAAFATTFAVMNGRQPTQQEVWNAAAKSGARTARQPEQGSKE